MSRLGGYICYSVPYIVRHAHRHCVAASWPECAAPFILWPGVDLPHRLKFLASPPRRPQSSEIQRFLCHRRPGGHLLPRARLKRSPDGGRDRRRERGEGAGTAARSAGGAGEAAGASRRDLPGGGSGPQPAAGGAPAVGREVSSETVDAR